MDFKVDSYGSCVTNKMVDGSYMTVMRHVDDLKVSHKESEEVTKFTRALGNKL